MRNKKIVEIVFKKGLHNFDSNDALNPLRNKLEQFKVLKIIAKYNNKRLIYRFLVKELIFSSGITNETRVLFIKGLSKALTTIINGNLINIWAWYI